MNPYPRRCRFLVRKRRIKKGERITYVERTCGQRISGRGRSKYCQRHASNAREDYKSDRSAADTKRWRTHNKSLNTERNRFHKYLERQGLTHPKLMARLLGDKTNMSDDLTRRQFMANVSSTVFVTLLEARPTSKTERYAQSWNHLQEVRYALAVGQEIAVRDRLYAYRAILEDDNSREARQLKLHFDTALRDVGTQGTREDVIQTNKHRAIHVYKAWTAQRNQARRAEALLVPANIYRTLDDFETALYLLRGSQGILEFYCLARNRDDLAAKIYLHQTTLTQLKIIASDYKQPNSPDAKEASQRLRALAEDINTPLTWLLTLREEAKCFMMQHEQQHVLKHKTHYLDLAEAHLLEAQRYAEMLPIESPRVQHPLLFTEIDFLFQRGDRDGAERLIPSYLDLHFRYPITSPDDIMRKLGVSLSDYNYSVEDQVHEVDEEGSYSSMLPYAYIEEAVMGI